MGTCNKESFNENHHIYQK